MKRHSSLGSGIAAALVLGITPAVANTPSDALVMAWNIDAISSFDPAQIAEVVTDEIIRNTCDSIVDFDPEDSSQFIPGLAESWEVSDDGLTVTFTLKEGIVFPDGSSGSAQDLVWSLHRVLQLGYGNAAALTEFGFTAENVEEMIFAEDDRTVVMKLDRPYPVSLVMARIAANRVAVMLNREVLEANAEGDDLGNAWLATRTECVGPYSLARWNAGEVVMLQANENYTGDAPHLPRVLIRHVAEAGTQRLLLEQGDVDVARNLSPEDIAELAQRDDIVVSQVLTPQMYYLSMNNSHPAFEDARVRLAMRYLIDYQGLGDSVMEGVGVPRASFVPIGVAGALSEEEGQPFSVDIDRARELLAEAGYADGLTVSMLIGSHAISSTVAQNIQENATQAGVTFNIEQMANAQLFARHRARDFDTLLVGYRSPVPDANGMASRFVFNPDNDPEAQLTQYVSWRSAYYNEDANAAVEAALFEADPEARIGLYEELQRSQMEEGAQAFIMQSIDNALHRSEVQNWTWNGLRVYLNHVSK